MSQIKNQVYTLVLGYFSKINAKITEKNGLFDIDIPNDYSELFRTNNLKIVFDDGILKPDNYELLSPGSNILFKILNECIDFGPVITAKLNSKEYCSKVIRFYFYVLFESIKSETKLIHVDIEIATQKIVSINNSEIIFNDDTLIQSVSSEIVDDCYIVATDHVEKLTKPQISEFKNQIYEMKNEELFNINNEYDKKFNDIQEQSIALQSKNASLDDLIFKNDSLKNEKLIILKNLENKFNIVIDFALIAAIVII